MGETRVTMPQLGESVHEGTISRWLVKPGDRVEEFEPMLEVDTDKVNAEVPSPVTGVLKAIIAQEGDTVAAGAEIAVVEMEGEGAPPTVELDAAPAKPAGPEPEAAPASAEPAGEAPAPAEPKREAPSPAAEPKPGPPSPATPEPAPEPGRAAPTPTVAAHRYSPAVVMLAQERSLDLSRIRGTGLGGRVTKKDVLQFVETGERAP
ncbi:MAG: biotin/lipoyl-containing protein, partial [Candidatus Dormibacteraceae bacterium]